MNIKINQSKAFTLTEVIISIAVASILLATVINAINVSRAKARDAKRVSDISKIQLALVKYFNRCGIYPHKLGLDSSNGCPAGVTMATFIQSLPVDPNGQSYEYYVRSDAGYNDSDYLLRSILEISGNPAMESSLKANPTVGLYLMYGDFGATIQAKFLPAVACDSLTKYCVGSH